MRRGPLQKALQPALYAALSTDSSELTALSSSTLHHISNDADIRDPNRRRRSIPSKSNVGATAAASTTCTSTSFSRAVTSSVALSGAAVRTVRNGSGVWIRTAAAQWQTAHISDVSSATADAKRLRRDDDDGEESDDDGTSTGATAAAAAMAATPPARRPTASTPPTKAGATEAASTDKKETTKHAAKRRKRGGAAVQKAAETQDGEALQLVGALRKALKPVPRKPGEVAQAAYRAKLRARAAQQEASGTSEAAAATDTQHPWRSSAADAAPAADDRSIAFSDSAAELFVLDEEKHDAAPEPENGEGEGADAAAALPPTDHAALLGAHAPSPAAAATDIDEPLLDDPFYIPSVDDDAFVRDGGAAPQSAAGAAAARILPGGAFAAGGSPHNEAVLSSVDLLCDDLFHCKTEVLRSFARSRRVRMRSKAEVVLQLVEQAHRAAHGESDDLDVTRKVLGDVFDESVRTSGVRSAWTNKSLEASHIEMACERHLRFELMANTRKTLMVRHNVMEASRVLRKLTRLFQEEQEHLSVVAVGGVFRNYRAEADELVRSMPVTELVSPFASFLVSYVRYGGSATALTRENVNERLVQMELFQPTVQEMDDTTILQRLMEMLDPAVREIEMEAAASARNNQGPHAMYRSPQAYVATVRAFSEASHTRWDTNAAPDWVHDLARLFCNWETIVRTDLARFEDVPRYFFDCILGGVVDFCVMQRIYGEAAGTGEVQLSVKRALKVALMDHLTNEENVRGALEDLLAYVHATPLGSSENVRNDFYAMVLSQMQGAFHDIQEERSALHDERVAVILRCIGDTASHCTRSHGLFSLLVRITEDMHFHLRFQRVYKKLSGPDRKTIRTKAGIRMDKTLTYFESEYHVPPLSLKAVGFLVVQMLYLALRGDGSKRPVLERFASVTGATVLDVVGLTEMKAVNVRDLHIAFPPQLSYNSWLNESDTREKSVYNVLPSVAVKGATNQAMIVSQAPMMKALDAISRVPWRINKYMLHVQEAIVREGFGFGKIRPGFYPLHYFSMSDGSIRYPSDRRSRTPGSPAEDDDAAVKGGRSGDPDGSEVFNIQQRRLMEVQQSADWKELTELRSSRIHYLQALRQARSILQFSHIYFPNSMDFRGRMYPLPGRLNHTGSDPFRGLLEYAEPKPLGTVGLYWLKVHLANKMGMSKLSFDERVHYVDEHVEDVVQSAESPLQGDRWWQEASEPLQCLMACKEVASALKCSQGPEKFLSRLPVAVDGSYNGLQHYSAIGRDAFGAALVNLIPSERPADAYTGILKEMLKSIHADAARDHQVAQRCLGTGKGQDKDHIKRKTIKRPIMTQVYGVTAFGMSEQIFDELQKQNKSHGLWTHTDMKEMAAYLRDKVLESLGVTFRETQNCRRWISEVVQLIWKVQPPELRNALCWTTPLGLVVRQPYKVRNECSLFTTSGYARIAGDSIAPASRKQLTAIAPNLIHSLDATHLAMTALEMQHQGLSMMAVHDSYWTYACDLPKLSQVLREQFVNLYSKYDPLWELKEQWEETYFMDLRRHGVKLPEPPKRGDLDLNQVLNSPYFFS